MRGILVARIDILSRNNRFGEYLGIIEVFPIDTRCQLIVPGYTLKAFFVSTCFKIAVSQFKPIVT